MGLPFPMIFWNVAEAEPSQALGLEMPEVTVERKETAPTTGTAPRNALGTSG